MGGKESNRPQNVGGTPSHADSLGNHLLGQLGRGQLYAVLQIDLIQVRIGAHRKGDGQLVSPVVGTGGGHIKHLFDAVDLFFNGRGHVVGHHLGVGPRVYSRDSDSWWRDGRILSHRNIEQSDEPGQGDKDGHDHCQTRAFDENS